MGHGNKKKNQRGQQAKVNNKALTTTTVKAKAKTQVIEFTKCTGGSLCQEAGIVTFNVSSVMQNRLGLVSLSQDSKSDNIDPFPETKVGNTETNKLHRKKARKLIEKAHTLYNEEKYMECIEKVTEAFRLDESIGTVDGYYVRGNAFLKLHRALAFTVDIRQALKIGGSDILQTVDYDSMTCLLLGWCRRIQGCLAVVLNPDCDDDYTVTWINEGQSHPGAIRHWLCIRNQIRSSKTGVLASSLPKGHQRHIPWDFHLKDISSLMFEAAFKSPRDRTNLCKNSYLEEAFDEIYAQGKMNTWKYLSNSLTSLDLIIFVREYYGLSQDCTCDCPHLGMLGHSPKENFPYCFLLNEGLKSYQRLPFFGPQQECFQEFDKELQGRRATLQEIKVFYEVQDKEKEKEAQAQVQQVKVVTSSKSKLQILQDQTLEKFEEFLAKN